MKNMKNWISLWALGLLFTAVFLLPQAAQAQACTNATFSGKYVFNLTYMGSSPQYVSYGGATVEVLTADGAGNITLFNGTGYAVNIPFTLLPEPTVGAKDPDDTNPPQVPQQPFATESGQGTYVVNPDCTMALTLHPSNFNCFAPTGVANDFNGCVFPIHWDVFLAKGGTVFYAITTDQGVNDYGAGAKL